MSACSVAALAVTIRWHRFWPAAIKAISASTAPAAMPIITKTAMATKCIAYTRWSTSAQLGWTPDEDTTVELSAAKSDGEAAYGDRGMDGTAFDRTNIGL